MSCSGRRCVFLRRQDWALALCAVVMSSMVLLARAAPATVETEPGYGSVIEVTDEEFRPAGTAVQVPDYFTSGRQAYLNNFKERALVASKIRELEKEIDELDKLGSKLADQISAVQRKRANLQFKKRQRIACQVWIVSCFGK
ncbi:uncharacterized protein LOC106161234 [Lingula anatina]|uniref:Uncharacterized protein LOC106161234 n=1 Tax=Lingula anatina TaxID=7574 RepID=A0A1S3I5Q9_LINAN|nr:uncharacterized protein LOC106161234 [Lingula anatina]|eukprot:XP_013393587.1 uncharacterized protein LOC106161234 [Lingula anatina]